MPSVQQPTVWSKLHAATTTHQRQQWAAVGGGRRQLGRSWTCRKAKRKMQKTIECGIIKAAAAAMFSFMPWRGIAHTLTHAQTQAGGTTNRYPASEAAADKIANEAGRGGGSGGRQLHVDCLVWCCGHQKQSNWRWVQRWRQRQDDCHLTLTLTNTRNSWASPALVVGVACRPFRSALSAVNAATASASASTPNPHPRSHSHPHQPPFARGQVVDTFMNSADWPCCVAFVAVCWL